MDKSLNDMRKKVPAKPHKAPSLLEARFMKLWDVLNGPPLECEYKFDPNRRWRADFVQIDAHILIEIEGGVWSRGRHLTPKGFLNDAEKYLAATLQGWTVLRLTTGQLNTENIQIIIAYVRSRLK